VIIIDFFLAISPCPNQILCFKLEVGAHFQSFDSLFGQETSEKDMPSGSFIFLFSSKIEFKLIDFSLT